MSGNSKFGLNVHIPQNPQLLDHCVRCGVGWIRVDFNWSEIETKKGQFDWGRYDRVIDAAVQRGLSVFGTLAYTPGWANGGQDRAFPPSDPGNWARFCETAAARFKGRVDHWGLWNEPNKGKYGKMSCGQYIEILLVPGAAALRRGNPACKTIGPELEHDNGGSWHKWLKEVLSRAGGSIDIVSHHLYKDDFENTWTGYFSHLDGWRTSIGSLFGKPTLRGVLKSANASGKPVWITETGWNAVKLGEGTQAKCLKECVSGLKKFPWITKMFFYELHDNPVEPDVQYGLLRADMQPRQLFGACRDAIANSGQ